MAQKWKDRGYWVSHHFYWQSILHYLCNTVRFRSLTYFSVVNPAIPFGGMLNDRKSDIDAIIPARYRPITTTYDPQQDLSKQLAHAGLSFPIIIKPDVGLKGHHVRKVNTLAEAQALLSHANLDQRWLLQSYVDYDREFSILYHHNTHTHRYGVSSLIEKQYPYVTGDGRATLAQLIDTYPNAYIDRDWIAQKWRDQLTHVPPDGQKIILDDIGNYSRGASFHSMMSAISPELVEQCKTIFDDFEGIHFFRMDLKADSLEGFLSGDFKVIEINGAKGEPLHIYDRQHSFWSNMLDISKHWRLISDIVVAQRRQGLAFPSNIEGLKALRQIMQVK